MEDGERLAFVTQPGIGAASRETDIILDFDAIRVSVVLQLRQWSRYSSFSYLGGLEAEVESGRRCGLGA